MNIDTLKFPDYAKDIKLNLNMLLNEDETLALTNKHIAVVTLAAAFASKNPQVIAACTNYAKTNLSLTEIDGVKAAAVIMAMNNIYYRFTHAVEDISFRSLPAKLRMSVMAKPGIDKLLFELASLAVSAINGCSMCMNAHSLQLEQAGFTKEAIQNVIRITSVINALSMTQSLN